MADSKQGAYAAKAADTDFRRKWDKEEYAEKARQKDEEERLRMQENEERMKQGTLPTHTDMRDANTVPLQARSLSRQRRRTSQRPPSS
jgi:hypothetical protein